MMKSIRAAELVVAGDVRALARAATLIESRSPAAEDLLREVFPHTGRATVVGVTGGAGAGKSTLVDRIVGKLRAGGTRAAVVAVDPTSPYSGGAILGDRIRMQQHHADHGVFIRSMATRGHLGGIAAATTDMVVLLDAAGYHTVLLETVGVGQDEIDVARVADVTIVVLVPGMGDDVQAMKAGIMEIADIFVINKSDLPGADRLQREVEGVLALSKRLDGWTVPIVRAVATDGTGVDAIVSAVEAFQHRESKRLRAITSWEVRLRDLYRSKLMERISEQQIRDAAVEVAERRRDPYSVVREWTDAVERREGNG
jgi:LAO/AO transport system kinase